MIKNIIDGNDVVISLVEYLKLIDKSGFLKGMLQVIQDLPDVPEHLKDSCKRAYGCFYD